MLYSIFVNTHVLRSEIISGIITALDSAVKIKENMAQLILPFEVHSTPASSE